MQPFFRAMIADQMLAFIFLLTGISLIKDMETKHYHISILGSFIVFARIYLIHANQGHL